MLRTLLLALLLLAPGLAHAGDTITLQVEVEGNTQSIELTGTTLAVVLTEMGYATFGQLAATDSGTLSTRFKGLDWSARGFTITKEIDFATPLMYARVFGSTSFRDRMITAAKSMGAGEAITAASILQCLAPAQSAP